ncbi:MAG TPA: 2-C-methyl-D-erythritol 2,4-cyclodiphosphate synthase [Sphaerochaeta sp.]|jgi:2-C-methyl-D-erythritol 2,4-cyclodiphosphate synthase|nr:MAG: 2-C-methyl-D-erythritol 2,4-cyclodiphosphate synthase [Spirochaetes bacterium GWC2_52_13]OHD67101.1 MAG: 2-C-methyl-D-erythritol 2,4-cyclodiphosphate synthase [Spirochaetes bacterium GWF2_52_7]PKL20783.1 MAG: 2-C-methyl-D-erythritol 2,4-cyclodiphosphate synthase [Spirochaetae bacterium HGW-Spirochaetae-4]HCG63408.1 2-C-methyl-D-erythritol 2,4-cyclodiphosphate synthase [Sphaerochaeta sp.]HCJ94955.1 2-C-methyl-D-erythritol 2,4-cyclodiphosphate synthase [Sphaerochaeta sp.]
MRIGTGWDIHPLVPGRKLLLGGVEIPNPLGESGHSDGDVLVHAIVDALLGALAKGDIGMHFPPSDPAYKDVSSLYLLRRVLDMLGDYAIENIDCTVILQKPKLQPHIQAIRESLAQACSITLERISVKAKTAEGLLGEVGEGKAIIAQSVVLLRKHLSDEECPLEDWV